MLVYYGIPTGIVFLTVLSAYLRDESVPKNRPFDWFFIVVVALLWPITAPSILWKKISTLRKQQSENSTPEVQSQPHSLLEAISRW